MARDQNTFAKRQREFLKKQKAADKRVRRQEKKDQPDESPTTAQGHTAEVHRMDSDDRPVTE
ncbi:MAG: hypothetical protein GXY83_04935 [Rhodopirellula sp.]|nr:hypothetical protein [Rhodopirellula sp.]